MNRGEFERQYLGEWKQDERYIALCQRLNKYYEDTPDSMPNREAYKHWKAFIEWAKSNGYSKEEINQAKRKCDNR